MDVETRMALQPAPDGGVLMGRIVVGDQMDVQRCRSFAVDLVQEANELLMPVALGALPQNPPSLDVEGGEQGHRAVHSHGSASSHGRGSAAAAVASAPGLGSGSSHPLTERWHARAG